MVCAEYLENNLCSIACGYNSTASNEYLSSPSL